MAEILGVVGSVVGVASFALELAESIKKLKDFCVRVANAPKTLQRTIKENEVLSNLLNQLSGTLGSAAGSTGNRSLQGCVDLCRVGVERIVAVTGDLDTKMNDKRRRTSIKFASCKDDLRDMMQELEQGKSSLLLAHQIYMQAQADDAAKLQHAQIAALLAGQVLVTQFTQGMHAAARPDSGEHPSRRVDVGHKDDAYSGFRIRTPAWLRRRVWELSVSRELESWTRSLTINLTTYLIIDDSSQTYKMCKDGDLLGLRHLFSIGVASPLDRIDDGLNLLERSILSGQMEVARFFYAHGASLEQWGSSLAVTYWLLTSVYALWPTIGFDELRHDLRFVLECCDHDLDDDGPGISGERRPDLRRFLTASQEEATMIWRWNALEGFADNFGTTGATGENEISCLLAHLDFVQLHHHTSCRSGHDELRKLETLVEIYARCWRGDVDMRLGTSVQTLIVHLIQAGLSPLDATANYRGRTLLRSFMTCVYEVSCYPWQIYTQLYSVLDAALQEYIRTLQRAGVDLEEYGMVESSCDADWLGETCYLYSGDGLPRWYSKTFGLSYGPQPQDWHFWWQHPGDEYAGEFWDMIDHPERTIPGAWDDEWCTGVVRWFND
ncbi:hypothetical protein LTR85_012182 [Meristemomyces frigidus]|nr:hypothetical protein LTR85_012182 [Meristemomyces frigidus]